ncbi:MAG: DUF4258 domain-containing protein [Chloroflexi bacterium]|nr:DUF4258 domain-containing protein [Chloroflexota bacterium]
MRKSHQLTQIQEKIKQRQYRLTSHAEREREFDKITIVQIEEAVLSTQADVIENYPEDVRGRSCLVLGFAGDGSPIHVVCGLKEEMLIIVTVYRPDPEQWVNWRKRRTAKP